ncbi:MAG: glycosyltransferase, partial [Myxococcales bacterium]|nr:glycosyltransferase [Myxococcales bacterium]
MAIPDTAHFIWYGHDFPWTNVLAIQSARSRGGFSRLVLHHDGALRPSHLGPGLAEHVELRVIAGPRHFAGLGQRGRALQALHERLRSPAAKANVLRMCILAQEGGVYLDVDTVTLQDLTPLRNVGAFCGCEYIVFPAGLYASRNPLRWGRALALSGLRLALREWPGGFAHFPTVAPWYATAVNNAVVGAAAGHPLVHAMLDAMLAMPEARQTRRYALGTHLLQQQVVAYRGDDLVVHPPEVFYPLPPEICLHWFRMRAHADPTSALSPNTRVVHWYASNRNKRLVAQLDPDYVRAHQHHQMFSGMAAEFLSG